MTMMKNSITRIMTTNTTYLKSGDKQSLWLQMLLVMVVAATGQHHGKFARLSGAQKCESRIVCVLSTEGARDVAMRVVAIIGRTEGQRYVPNMAVARGVNLQMVVRKQHRQERTFVEFMGAVSNANMRKGEYVYI
jgi:hypothetical protein